MNGKLVRQVIDRDWHRCRVCGWGGGGGLNIHHILFRSQGGKDELSNLILLCRPCHDKAHGIGKHNSATWPPGLDNVRLQPWELRGMIEAGEHSLRGFRCKTIGPRGE